MFIVLVLAIFMPFSLWAGGVCVRRDVVTVKKIEPALADNKNRKPQVRNKNEKPVTLSKYTPLYWSGEKEKGWLKVEGVDGRPYLIRKKDVSFSMRCVAVRVDKSRLRQGPGSQFERALVAERGDSFLDLGSDDGWIQVMNNKGEKAWLNIDHSWRPTSRMRMQFEPEVMSADQ